MLSEFAVLHGIVLRVVSHDAGNTAADFRVLILVLLVDSGTSTLLSERLSSRCAIDHFLSIYVVYVERLLG